MKNRQTAAFPANKKPSGPTHIIDFQPVELKYAPFCIPGYTNMNRWNITTVIHANPLNESRYDKCFVLIITPLCCNVRWKRSEHKKRAHSATLYRRSATYPRKHADRMRPYRIWTQLFQRRFPSSKWCFPGETTELWFYDFKIKLIFLFKVPFELLLEYIAAFITIPVQGLKKTQAGFLLTSFRSGVFR